MDHPSFLQSIIALGFGTIVYACVLGLAGFFTGIRFDLPPLLLIGTLATALLMMLPWPIGVVAATLVIIVLTRKWSTADSNVDVAVCVVIASILSTGIFWQLTFHELDSIVKEDTPVEYPDLTRTPHPAVAQSEKERPWEREYIEAVKRANERRSN